MRSLARMQLAAAVAALVWVIMPTATQADDGSAWLGVWLAETPQISGFEHPQKQIVSIVSREEARPKRLVSSDST
jgi:hypothetical protein